MPAAARKIISAATRAHLSEDFRRAALTHGRLGSALYVAIVTACADDADMLELAAHAQAGQPPAYFLTCAVHYLLHHEPAAELARYYPSLTPTPLPPADVFPVFREFCRSHRAQLIDILQTRTVQTTSVDRAAYVLPALEWVADIAGEPLALIEIGCSAGLLLLLDQYAYEYTGYARIGATDAAVALPSCFRGDHRHAPKRIPQFSRRIGIDLDPVDVNDADVRLWIEGLLYPDWVEERARLRQAMTLRGGTALDVIKGNALTVLPDVLQTVDDPVCIFHSNCLYQWPQAAKEALESTLIAASRGRVLHRIGIEVPELEQASMTAGFFADDLPPRSSRIPINVTYTCYENTVASSRIIARCEGYGRWFEWYE